MRGRIVAAASWLLLGCEPEVVEEVCVHDPPLTYESFGRGFVSQYCLGCHSTNVPPNHRNDAPPDINFDAYTGILLWSFEIDQLAAVTDPDVIPSMPPGGGPTLVERELLAEWIQCEVIPDAAEWASTF